MKVLIVGLGSIALKHINAIRKIDSNATIYALRSSLKAETVDRVINVFSLNEVLSLDVDFIIIATPTALHKEAIQSLLILNKPLFIEKPVYHKIDIEDIIIQIRERGIETYVACNLRFLDSLQFVASTIKERVIQEINCYCGSYLPDWRNTENFRLSYSAQSELGGGVHLDLIHELDYLYWLLGKPNVSDKLLKSSSSLQIDAIDYANYRLIYKSFVANVVLNYYRRDAKRIFEIVFEDETWVVDILANHIFANGKLIFESSQKVIDTYYDQMTYFYNCVQSKTPSFNTIEDGINVLKICIGA
ncbi:MAG: Gfo/Idh/MocA family oxidoreductase [Filimonas sp.]|nr:Gfo/Idh/MocA family oxidoreductase [Filimonas sp.]